MRHGTLETELEEEREALPLILLLYVSLSVSSVSNQGRSTRLPSPFVTNNPPI